MGAFDLRKSGKAALNPPRSREPLQRDKPNGGWSRPVVSGLHIKNMQFKSLGGKTFMLQDIPIKATVRQLKEILWHEKGVDENYARLAFGGKEFENG